MAEKIRQESSTATAPMSKTKLKQTIWPDPFVIPPPPPRPHTHSIILLHGRGSNGPRFGEALLAAKTSSGKTLAEHSPTAKFIFPTAKKRRSTVLKRVPISQWFDSYSADSVVAPSARQDSQYDGIRETSVFVHGLIGKEAREIGIGRVIVGGLSQACAAALHVLLNWRPDGGEALGAFVRMSGWLPFANVLDPRTAGGRELQDGVFGHDEDDDIFGSDDDDCENSKANEDAGAAVSLEKLQLRAANTARDIASLPLLSEEPRDSPVFARTPIFLGHGRNDEKVSDKLGEQARGVMSALRCKVRWEDYDEGHWYKIPEEIDNIVGLLEVEGEMYIDT